MFTQGMPHDRKPKKRNVHDIAIRKYIVMKYNRSHHDAEVKLILPAQFVTKTILNLLHGTEYFLRS
jgi:hypothetical protein